MKSDWVIYLIFIIVIILLIPKPCGFKVPSKELKYTCYGFETPFMEYFQPSTNPTDFCSGICTSKSVPVTIVTNTTDTSGSSIPIIDDLFTKIKQVAPSIGLIILIVILIMIINQFNKKSKGADIQVIKGPGQ